MEHITNWKFKKLSDLLPLESQKKNLYKLYKNSNSEVKKVLFLYLSYEESNKAMQKLLGGNGLLVMNGINKYIWQEENIFNDQFKFVCDNPNCTNHNKEIVSDRVFYIKCKACDQNIHFINKKQLINTFDILYLNHFDFYLVNEADKTQYIIRNKYNGKHYIKSSDEALTNWIYLKLVENNCHIFKYMTAIYGGGKIKNIKKSLLDYLKDNLFIKTIDNLNFLPKQTNLFKQESKTYFNLYRGNDYLNKPQFKGEVDFLKECPCINELLFNLTNKDEKGVSFIVDILAMILQEPHIKSKQLIIFYGEEASGKGTFYDLILYPLFQGYITKILGKKIKSTFNSFMSQKLILVLEEVKADKDEEDTLKELVTEDKILINPKGLSERYEDNYLTVFGFSNEQNPISVGKRRGTYFNSRTLGGTTDKAPEYRKRFEKQIPIEFESFINHLKSRKYDRMELMRGYETEAKKQVISQNLSMIGRFCEELYNYADIGKYISEQLMNNRLNSKGMEYHIQKSKELTYIRTGFILELYNSYLRANRYNMTTLNKLSEFWQIMKIDRDNKTHYKRILNKENDKKEFYVNIDLINNVIKMEYDKE